MIRAYLPMPKDDKIFAGKAKGVSGEYEIYVSKDLQFWFYTDIHGDERCVRIRRDGRACRVNLHFWGNVKPLIERLKRIALDISVSPNAR